MIEYHLKKETIKNYVAQLPKHQLIIHLISSIQNECYLYAGILRDEIQHRHFSEEEVNSLKNSTFYAQMNRIFG